jgi:hypothetical protein
MNDHRIFQLRWTHSQKSGLMAAGSVLVRGLALSQTIAKEYRSQGCRVDILGVPPSEEKQIDLTTVIVGYLSDRRSEQNPSDDRTKNTEARAGLIIEQRSPARAAADATKNEPWWLAPVSLLCIVACFRGLVALVMDFWGLLT